MSQQLPIAEILECHSVGGVLHTTLRLDQVPGSPVAPATLWRNRDRVLDLHALVERAEGNLTFETYDPSATPLAKGDRYVLISWWRADDLALVQGVAQTWPRRAFEPADMIMIDTEHGRAGRRANAHEAAAGRGIVKGGWDHEHCVLCWQKMSLYPGNQRFGYTDGNRWLCEACHAQYIASGLGLKLGERIR